MLDDVKNMSNSQVSLNSLGNKDSHKKNSPAFKGNPNAVDTTPTADTYQAQPVPPQGQSAKGPLGNVGYIVPTWYILNKGTQLFDRSCGGEYEKSLVGRLGRLGDKLSGTPLVRNGFVDRIKTYCSGIKKNLQSFVDRHPMLSAMQKTPTKPENSMPKSFMETQAEADIKEASGKLAEFFEKRPKSLKAAGASKAEIEALKSKFGTDMFGRIKNAEAAIQEFQITKLGGPNALTNMAANQAKIAQKIQSFETQLASLTQGTPEYTKLLSKLNKLKDISADYANITLGRLKRTALGLKKSQLEILKSDPVANSALLEKALEKGKNFMPKLSESFNKIKSIHAPKTALGKLFPKMAKLGMRGLTFGGGLFNTLFIAFTMAGSIKNAIDAPKEQKTGTIAGGLLEAMSWVVSMPLALGAMHKVSGIQYTGLDKTKVEAFRTAQKAFNAKAKAGLFANKAAYDAEKAVVEGMKAVSGKQGWFTKAAKGFAKFIGIGLEQYTPYKEATANLVGKAKWSTRLANLGRKMPNFLKNCIGYPLRFGLYMFVFAPIVEKIFSGVTSAIFGKPYDPEKIKEEQEKEAARRAQLYPGPRVLPLPGADANVGTSDLNQLSDGNLIKQKVTGIKPAPNGDFNNTTGSNQPFMPPVQPNQNEYDPNKSEYDTVPRSYVPKIDFNNPIQLNDPMMNPNAERNYDSAQKLADKSDKLADDVEAFLKGKS